MAHTAYLSLGSNIGDRSENLARALDLLRAAGVKVTRESSLWETEPRDYARQPWFLNQVVEAETTLFPRQLLHLIRRIEKELGRRRIVARGPRTIDIDILLFGNFVIDVAELQVPHPRLRERRFVLAPLAELAPELKHPVTRQSVNEMLAAVREQPARKFELAGR